ncbi:tetraacyldisaccharide 4'-kinase [Ramlibacter sp. H39-3-26]|nr:tetraacyldisaccharide 4'-kinase [Ramlibacter sp. H39-3-26]
MWPASLLYGAAVHVRHWLYACGAIAVYRAPVPVVVVGNVAVGGVGKTPVVIEIVRHLRARGFRPGVLSRGYGRRTGPGSAAVCAVTAASDPAEAGDEPAMIHRATGAPVFVASARSRAASALLATHADTDVLVCDDGLQHYALARDVEVCVFDDRGIGNGFQLPAGLLREAWPRTPPPGVRMLVLHTGNSPAFAGFRAYRTIAQHACDAHGTVVPFDVLRAAPLCAVAGIGQPQIFFDALRSQGLRLERVEALPDHADFSIWTNPCGTNRRLVCTEKDAVKLWRTHPQALAVPLHVRLDDAFWDAFDQALQEASLSSGPALEIPHREP